MLDVTSLFALSEYAHRDLFRDALAPWAPLSDIDDYIKYRFSHDLQPAVAGHVDDGAVIVGDVYIGPGTHVESGAYVSGPAIIGSNCEIRQGAYIRGNIVTGDRCVIGHTTEVKNSIFLDGAHAPHFAYVGDSILGNRVNLGAGTKLANLRLMSTKDPQTRQRPNVRLVLDDQIVETALSKIGAILGDDVQLGCNVVTAPGCVVGARTLVYPLVSLRSGYYPPDSIVKLRQELEVVTREAR